jgi:hypothetical protein
VSRGRRDPRAGGCDDPPEALAGQASARLCDRQFSALRTPVKATEHCRAAGAASPAPRCVLSEPSYVQVCRRPTELSREYVACPRIADRVAWTTLVASPTSSGRHRDTVAVQKCAWLSRQWLCQRLIAQPLSPPDWAVPPLLSYNGFGPSSASGSRAKLPKKLGPSPRPPERLPAWAVWRAVRRAWPARPESSARRSAGQGAAVPHVPGGN